MKVLWIWDWDERMKWTEVLFKTDNGFAIARFGDETLSAGLYPSAGGKPCRHTLFCEQVIVDYNHPEAGFMELFELYQQTDKTALTFRKSYAGRYASKCYNGWRISVADCGLPSPQINHSP